MLNKEMLMKENRNWVRSELETLTSSIQPWYARNMQLYSEDSLSEQHVKSLRFIIIDDNNNEHWKINDILNFRCYQDWIQYKIKWKDLDRNNEWYYVNKDEFNDFKKVLNEFHMLYSRKSR